MDGMPVNYRALCICICDSTQSQTHSYIGQFTAANPPTNIFFGGGRTPMQTWEYAELCTDSHQSPVLEWGHREKKTQPFYPSKGEL